MRGRTISPVLDSTCLDCSSYVQINLYGTNIKELRERGVNVKKFVESLGCRSIIMDVPILDADSNRCPGGKKNFSSASAAVPSNDQEFEIRDSAVRIVEPPRARPSDSMQDCCEGNSHSSIVNDEELATNTCQTMGYGSPLKTSTPNSTCFVSNQANADKEIFQDCLQDYEKGEDVQPTCEPSAKSKALTVPVQPTKISSLSNAIGDALKAIQSDDVIQMHSDISQLECIQMNGCSQGVNANKPLHAVPKTFGRADIKENWNFTEHDQNVSEEDCLLTLNDHRNLNVSADRSVEESNVLRNDVLQVNNVPKKKGRKRAHRSSSTTAHQLDTDEMREENKDPRPCAEDTCKQLGNSQRIFRCRYPNCTVKLCWRPRYGKNRLVNHVRVHWGKKMKKCCFCDYVATQHRKVFDHLNRFHKESKGATVISLETEEDMDELLNLWKQCFPDAEMEEFCDPKVKRTHRFRYST